ncbi:hypothetical protein ARAM_006557 [Aspergillus rambellii]|uniref:tRNA (guanine(9)-N1)-methyltransferase n=1 Tax=Aspergillus rambellii TaxID=308745 RepID=A0A0F8WDR2_9EURO|nr:hypothetical protein ARAM_006557 [Aspergillus rambellii]
MEEEERPRKLQKLDVAESKDEEPLMTGATGSVRDETPAQAGTQSNTSIETNVQRSIPKDGEAQAANGSEDTASNMSKRQLRKLRQREVWEEGREERKVKRKERAAARKDRRKAAWEEAKQQGNDTREELRKIFPIQNRRRRPTRIPITLVIDCGFDDLMMEKERISLGAQLTRSYSENNRSPYSTHLVVSSFDKLLKERFETVLHKTHENWRGVRFMEEDFLHAANQATEWMQGPEGGKMVGPFADKTDAKPEDGEIIYLSSDSPETLTELKPYSTYIIGGLVDKNRHKGICYERATELGIKTAKLPIGDYIQMAHRSVLATNHVIEIMVRWLELGDWGEAFMKTLPSRKGGVLKSATQDSADSTPQPDDSGEVEVADVEDKPE